MINMISFFDKHYQKPQFLKDKALSRRHFLKSAAGASAVIVLPVSAISASRDVSDIDLQKLNELIKTDPWLTLNATLNQLLPKSPTGPSAIDIKALNYLYGVMTIQPTADDEKAFVLKGVGWLNGYAQSQKGKNFVDLPFDEKEILLKNISKSRAGENWLSTLVSYIFEAMLSSSSYGGNPNGIGWQWLEHQAGFPLPKIGQRFFELPRRQQFNAETIDVVNISTDKILANQLATKSRQKGTRKS